MKKVLLFSLLCLALDCSLHVVKSQECGRTNEGDAPKETHGLTREDSNDDKYFEDYGDEDVVPDTESYVYVET